MAARFSRLILTLLLPFALASCVLTPGKFVSTLRIDADRHFTFTYVGEVLALDISDDMMKGMGDNSPDTPADPAAGDGTATLQKLAFQDKPDAPSPDSDGKDDAKTKAAKKAAADAKNRTIAETLSKEAGYRKVAYLGDGKFSIDYAISGTLDHAFLWPYNVDAELVFPFIAIELRANNTIRMKAPAFANDSSKSSGGMAMPGLDKASDQLDGVFTLDTNAEIVSQNNEDGAVTVGGRKTITWKATPLTKDAPSAVLRMAAK
ncbi:MAG: hypothetical protein P0Y59_22700 [Candidatus Sphingomonas phytovorans]|nr:hypothetical protein [Sphingomonas sp.]WEJ99682.1 MAG: hypothetical protein P0Y59_22700 [Sphingomonas sp.]